MDLLNVAVSQEAAVTATLALCIRELLAATALHLDIKDDKVAEKYTLARMNAREALRKAGL